MRPGPLPGGSLSPIGKRDVVLENALSGQGRLYRVLFRMAVPLGGRSASELFAAGPLEIEGPSGRRTTEVVLRLAPYVVSTFGEAFLLAPASFPLGPGDRLTILQQSRPIAVAVVADELNPETPPPDPSSSGSASPGSPSPGSP